MQRIGTQKMSKIKVSDYIFKRIAAETGVDTVFMLPGGKKFCVCVQEL